LPLFTPDDDDQRGSWIGVRADQVAHQQIGKAGPYVSQQLVWNVGQFIVIDQLKGYMLESVIALVVDLVINGGVDEFPVEREQAKCSNGIAFAVQGLVQVDDPGIFVDDDVLYGGESGEVECAAATIALAVGTTGRWQGRVGVKVRHRCGGPAGEDIDAIHISGPADGQPVQTGVAGAALYEADGIFLAGLTFSHVDGAGEGVYDQPYRPGEISSCSGVIGWLDDIVFISGRRLRINNGVSVNRGQGASG